MSTSRTTAAVTAAAVLTGLGLVAAPASAAPVEDVSASIVWVDVETPVTVEVPWEEGGTTDYSTSLMSYCTGFFVSDEGHIATAGHCVEPNPATRVIAIDRVLEQLADEGYDMSGFDARELDWTTRFGRPTAHVGQPKGVRDGIFSGQTSTVAQIVDYQGFQDGDNALLRVADLDGTPGLQIAEDGPGLGGDVTSIGFPGSVSDVSDVTRQLPSYKSGSVSSRQYSDRGVPATEIDAAVSQGMSGGPTVDASGAVIGINSFGIKGESQPFNFVTDTETLRDFLTRNGVTFESAPAAATEEEGTKAADEVTQTETETTGATETTETETTGATETTEAEPGDDAVTTTSATSVQDAQDGAVLDREVAAAGALPAADDGAGLMTPLLGGLLVLVVAMGGFIAGTRRGQQHHA